ncbi:MAG TPA: alpha/beta fold hydrolase, partial [Methylomirabilota bacterium]
MTETDDYRSPWWLRGRHLQSLWGPLMRRPPRPALRRERWDTPDGDFLDLDWLAAPPADPGAPCVMVLHGLEGSSESHYAAGVLALAEAAGWAGVVLHFRSCSGELNRLPRLYHSGETSDLDWVIGRLLATAPSRRLGLVGISLGGNVALKWLGERGESAPAGVAAAVAISVPYDLEACAGVLDRGL